MDAKGFGGRVLQARLDLSAKERRTVTQVEVAKQLGVTGVTVGRWEAGLKEPDLQTIERLAVVLEVDPRWLAFGENDPPAKPRGVLPLKPPDEPYGSDDTSAKGGSRRRAK